MLSNVTFRTSSSSSCTKPSPFQTHAICLYPPPTLLLVPFPDLLIMSPLLLKTLVFWLTVFCGFSNSVDEALSIPYSQLLRLHSPSHLSHLLLLHNPAWQDLGCLRFTSSYPSSSLAYECQLLQFLHFIKASILWTRTAFSVSVSFTSLLV